MTVLLQSCSSPDIKYDLSSESYTLVNADSTSQTFPDDFKGNITIVTFIYTNCPDVCPVITANLKNIQKKIENSDKINFVEISFDPERDTPSVLRDYRKLYDLNNQFTMLTGDTTTVNSVTNRLQILAKKSYPDSLSEAEKEDVNYAMIHTNKLYVMDEKGRIRFKYPASQVPPKNVIEDINKIR